MDICQNCITSYKLKVSIPYKSKLIRTAGKAKTRSNFTFIDANLCVTFRPWNRHNTAIYYSVGLVITIKVSCATLTYMLEPKRIVDTFSLAFKWAAEAVIKSGRQPDAKGLCRRTNIWICEYPCITRVMVYTVYNLFIQRTFQECLLPLR